ncbi:MAG: TolC family protein, partial [Candidatus Obscuribacterales bacterium]|nr:TolC family protein [Candidatus Obscuribacterales bacterium]
MFKGDSAAAGFLYLCALILSVSTSALAQESQPTGDERVPLRGLQAPAETTTPGYSVKPGDPVVNRDANKVSPDKPPDKKEDLPLSTPLDEIRFRSIESSGTIFVDPEKISVKAPVLSALITLNSKMSPYQLDAGNARELGLKETLLTALGNNLNIKIVNSQTGERRWQYFGNLANFLPTLDNAITFQGLRGSLANPAGVALPLTNPFLTMNAGFSQPIFTGGKLLYSALQAKHEYKASQYLLKGSTNDVLLQATRLYYKLLEDEVLLQIRIKALEVSDGLVELNQDLYEGGVVTKLDVLQARTQRSKDRQHLITQQVDRRKAAVDLSTSLNLNTDVDLSAADRMVAKTRLIDENIEIGELLRLAVDNRPELKQFDELRIAAKDAIKVARAALLPHVNFTGAVLGTGSKVTSLGQD